MPTETEFSANAPTGGFPLYTLAHLSLSPSSCAALPPTLFYLEYTLLFLTEGEGELVTDGDVLPVGGGEVFFLPPDTLALLSAKTPLKGVTATLSDAFLSALGLPPEGQRFLPVLSDRGAAAPFTRFLSYGSETGATAPLRAHGALCELLLSFAERALSSGEAAPVGGVKAALRYMYAHLSERILLSDMAAAAGMGRTRFVEVFHRTVGATPIDYLNGMRCRYARTLLLSGNYSVSDAAFLSGFDNLSYFSRTFRRYHGVLPSAYKREK